MNWKTCKGQVLIFLGGVYFLAGIVLALLNMKNYCDWTLYGAIQYGHSVGAIMLISAGLGAVAVFVLKGLLRGVRDLRQGRVQTKLKRVDEWGKTRQKNAPSQRETGNFS